MKRIISYWDSRFPMNGTAQKELDFLNRYIVEYGHDESHKAELLYIDEHHTAIIGDNVAYAVNEQLIDATLRMNGYKD